MENKHQKEEVINKILQNRTYLPESGLMLRLSKELSKLSLSVLRDLELVLSLKDKGVEGEEG